jgi:TonB-linked SusC/RagA family outer membrane protein
VHASGQEDASIQRSVSVTDTEGKPVTASIFSDRNMKVICTGGNGVFNLKALPNEVILIEADGYEPVKKPASFFVDSSHVRLLKKPHHLRSSDAVILPFHILKKRQIPNAVFTLNAAEIEATDSRQSVADALEGRIPGVFGSTNIRGLGNALIVIDGFPAASSSYGSNYDILNYYDLSDIEQISWLKDVPSGMLYGSEAHSGVVLITTKRGEAHKTKVGLRAEAGVEVPKSYPDYLNAADYMTMYNRAAQNDGLEEVYTSEQIAATREGTDHVKYPDEDFYNSTYLKDFSTFSKLSAHASGGNEQARYYSKVGWRHSGSLYSLEQEGKSFTNNELTFMGNVDYNITSWLKSNLDVFFLYGADRQPVRNFWSDAASQLPNSFPMLIPLSMINDEAIADKAKIFDGNILGGTNQYKNNIYANFVQGGYTTYTSRISQMRTGFDFNLGKLAEGLSAKVDFIYSVLNSYNLSYNHGYAVYEPAWVPAVGYSGDSLTIKKIGLDSKSQSQSLTKPAAERRLGFSGVVNYDRTFGEKHTLQAVLSSYQSKYDTIGAVYSKKQQVFGLSTNYMYDNRFVAQLSATYTGSGYLPKHQRYKAAPSVGLAWILSEENFLKGNNAVNYLKIKAAYGTLVTDAYMYHHKMYASAFYGGGTFTYNQNINSNSIRTFGNLGNPDIDMIRRKSLTVGLEASLAGDRLWLEGGYFENTLSGQIIKRTDTYPAYIPVLQWENYDKRSHKGFEAGITCKNRAGDFRYRINANMVYSLPNTDRIDEPVYTDAPWRQRLNQPTDAIWGYEALGLFADAADIAAHADQSALGSVTPGDIKYRDLNNDEKIDENDQKIIGNRDPRFGYGINLTIGYKNLSLFATGSGQYDSEGSFSGSYYRPEGNTAKYSDIVLGSWTPATAATDAFPALHLNAANNNYVSSTYWLEKMNAFNLHAVQLTYDIRPGFCKNLQLYVRGSNLLTISPARKKLELNIATAPQMRIFALGCHIVF